METQFIFGAEFIIAQIANDFIATDVHDILMKPKRKNTDVKEIAKRNAYHSAWFLYENDFFQYQQNLIPADVWHAKVNAFKKWYNKCEMRYLFEVRSKWMPVTFRELIESFPDECKKS